MERAALRGRPSHFMDARFGGAAPRLRPGCAVPRDIFDQKNGGRTIRP
ncbi:hypothetical protein SAMN04488003_10147 [Loktanella fryxellensis]|uniref:Uncharacterized protein n=1 Tax=Loktanella fryxellensis TaxID=245187 RepID=A0A1H7YA92_9RHOB|nr:hypothetical protein SAMN04488003_10147 [Loktanella fryxellensis]